MITYILIFLVGLAIGSFLNVLILRLPEEKNIALPSSYCWSCKKPLRWFHNIPLFSYLALKGKSACCSQKISYQYPLVELLTGFFALVTLGLALYTGSDFILAIVSFAALSVFTVIFLIDWRYQIIPDSLNIYLAVLFCTYSVIYYSWSYWLLGALIGFGFPYAITWAFYLLRGVEGLGGGDIKLYGALGLFFGPLGILQIIFLSSFLGSIVFLVLLATKKMKRDQPIAFGPAIVIVAGLQILFPTLFQGILF